MSKQTKNTHSAPSALSCLTHSATGQGPEHRTKYIYDAAGNLNWRVNNSLNLIFNVNALNELTNVFRNPGSSLTVAGVSSLVATSVTVNADSAQLFSDNTFVRTNALLADGTNTYVAVATSADGSNASATVSVNLPASANYLYDGRGNLTNDGLRFFEYDDENQLKAAMVPNAWRSEFAYDGLHRRRVRREYTWNGTWVTASEVHYIYDGRVVLQERNGNNVPLVTYTRGLDLSGSLQDAGGIGGLLARTDHSTLNSQLSTAFYHCDGNGNVTCMVDASGSVVARYAYDPFGNILAMSGTLAEANLYRFSSKEYHPNSGLVYYLYRFYDPNLQRWLNRDPIDEQGGINLHEFCYSDPFNLYDSEGLCVTPETAWDVANMAMDAQSFGENLGLGNYGAAALDLGGYALDSAAAVIPVVPGGVGAALKASRLARKAAQAANQLHHAYPKYLGGPVKQVLEKLPTALHKDYHRALDKIAPRRLGKEFYDKLSPNARANLLDRLEKMTGEFDKLNGTKIRDALVEELGKTTCPNI